MIKHLQNENDFSEIIKGNVLIDFTATWCGPCRMLGMELEDLDEEGFTNEIEIVKVDVDEFPNIARRYMIQAVPTLMHFVNNERKNVTMGYLNKEQIIEFCKK